MEGDAYMAQTTSTSAPFAQDLNVAVWAFEGACAGKRSVMFRRYGCEKANFEDAHQQRIVGCEGNTQNLDKSLQHYSTPLSHMSCLIHVMETHLKLLRI